MTLENQAQKEPLQEGIMNWEDFIEGQDTTKEEEEQAAPPVESEVEEVEEEIEQEEVAQPATEIEEPVKPAAPKESQSNSYYKDLARKFIEKGKWQEATVDTEDGEVALSELEDIDEETFFAIQEQQDELAREDLNEKFISKEGLNDTALKIIELQKNGGDITEAMQVYKEYVHPLEGLDLDNERVQEYLVRMDLQKRGNDEDIIQTTIEKYKKNLTLDKKANEVIDFTNKAWDKYMEDQNLAAAETKNKKEEQHKEYIKTLKDSYKDLDLDNKLKNKFLQVASTRDENGEPEAVRIFREKLQDPKTANELLYFLLEPETYKKSIGAKENIKNNVETFRKINLVKSKDKKQTKTAPKKEDTTGGLDFFPVEKI